RKFGRCATVLGMDANRVERSDPEWAAEQDRAAGRPVQKLREAHEGGLVPRRRFLDDRGVPMVEYWEVFVNGGRLGMGVDVLWWAKEAERLGAGEIVLNVMDADGTKAGYDLEMTAAVSSAVSIPVVASGGAGSPEDMYKVLTSGKADAALAASIFHFREHSVAAVKSYLRQRGVNVRLN